MSRGFLQFTGMARYGDVIHKTTGMGTTEEQINSLSTERDKVYVRNFSQLRHTEAHMEKLEQLIGAIVRPNLNPKPLSLAIAIIISKL